VSDIDVHHLAAAYTLDALEPFERAAFEAHYESCDVCRADVLAFRETMTHVAESLATAPPASLKGRVMADVAVTRQLSPLLASSAAVSDLDTRRRRRSVAMVLSAAAVIVAIVVGVVAVVGRRDDTYAGDLAHLMEQPDVQMVALENKGEGEGEFKVMWSPSMGEAALIGEHLPAAPAGMGYELWLITPDQSMAMSVLDPAANGKVHRLVPAPAAPTAWAITMEPKTGSAVATGDIIYLAEVPATA
jgi:anti-sigma-K factor RskA